MGFLLAGMGVAMLFFSVVLFSYVFGDDWTGLYEAITGFGLGGSAIALFGRCAASSLQELHICVMNISSGMLVLSTLNPPPKPALGLVNSNTHTTR